VEKAKDGNDGEKALEVLLNTVVLFDHNDQKFAKLLNLLVTNAHNNASENGVMKLKQIAIGQMAGKLCAAIDSWSDSD
jgi:hypothetical protein